MTVIAAVAAWLGGSIIVLADARRGLALGLGVTGAGLAAAVALEGHRLEGAVLLAGGLAAAALTLGTGSPGWGMMRAGSTPRLMLALVVGLLGLWLAAAVASGPDGAIRFAVPVELGLLVTRIVIGAQPGAAVAAASGLALTLGAGALLAGSPAALASCAVAAAVAAALPAIPRKSTDAA